MGNGTIPTSVMRAWRSVRANRGPLGFIVLALVMFFVLLRVGVDTATNTFERDLILVLGGTIIGAVSTVIVQLIQRMDNYKQGAYTERAKAVQEVVAEARAVKVRCMRFWDNREKDGEVLSTLELEAHLGRLLSLAFHHTVWIGPSGVQAVREFNDSVKDPKTWLQLTRKRAEDFVGQNFERLVDSLMADLGYSPP